MNGDERRWERRIEKGNGDAGMGMDEDGKEEIRMGMGTTGDGKVGMGMVKLEWRRLVMGK